MFSTPVGAGWDVPCVPSARNSPGKLHYSHQPSHSSQWQSCQRFETATVLCPGAVVTLQVSGWVFVGWARTARGTKPGMFALVQGKAGEGGSGQCAFLFANVLAASP